MAKDYQLEMAYVGRVDGKIVAMCMARPAVVLCSLQDFVNDGMTITLENADEAKKEWVDAS